MKTKKQIANKLLSKSERQIIARVKGASVFDSMAWRRRVASRKLQVIRRVKRVTIRRLEREIAKDNGTKVKYSIA